MAAKNVILRDAAGNAQYPQTRANQVYLNDNTTVQDAVATLSASGYVFLGEAIPTTNPGTPDTRVFYVATQAATYPNFNNIVVPEGASFLLYDNSWSLKNLVEIVDNLTTDNASKALSAKQGKVLSEQVTQLGQDVDVIGQQAQKGYASLSITPTQVGHLNIDSTADKFSHSASGTVYVYYVPILKGQHAIYKATNGSIQTFRYAFSQSVPAQDVRATGVYRGSETSVDIDVESPVNGYFAVYHGGSYFIDQTFAVGTETIIKQSVSKVQEENEITAIIQTGAIREESSSFVSGYYNMSGKIIGDKMQNSMVSSSDLDTAVISVQEGMVLLCNTGLVASTSVTHAFTDDENIIIALPTTAQLNAGIIIPAGVTKAYIVYRISAQVVPISLVVYSTYELLNTRINSFESASEFLSGSIEKLNTTFSAGFYNMTGKSIGSTMQSSMNSSEDKMTGKVAIAKGQIVTCNTKFTPTSAVKHALIDVENKIVGFPTTTQLNAGYSMTDAEAAAGGCILVIVYSIEAQDVPISVVRSDTYYYIKNQLSKSNGVSLYNNKTVILCGDSQLGQAQGVDELIQGIVGGTILNCGFGGCRMSWRTNDGSDQWDAFTMVNIADCLVSGDFSSMRAQTSVISSYPYFATAIDKLDSVTMGDGKDIVLTIAYGGNDYNGGASIGELGTEDKTTFLGAFEYAVDKLMTAFPRLVILVLGLVYKVYDYETDPETGGKIIITDSDNYVKSSGLTRADYNNALYAASGTLKLPVFDVYARGGRNKYNIFDLCPDGTHPTTPAGKQAEAELYAKILQTF